MFLEVIFQCIAILALDDVAYPAGSLLTTSSQSHLIAFFAILLTYGIGRVGVLAAYKRLRLARDTWAAKSGQSRFGVATTPQGIFYNGLVDAFPGEGKQEEGARCQS